VGPGAGFALASSFFAIFVAVLAALFVLLTLPFRWLLSLFGLGRRKRKPGDPRRVIILGLDGLDPRLATQYMDAGDLPNFKQLADQGHFSPLATTCPSVSPVAWSTFQTGVNPGRHNVFDFLTWDRHTYLPRLSSSEVTNPGKILRLGPFAIPWKKANIELLRKSKPFWDFVAKTGAPCVVLRVPITYPPEKGKAMTISGMCAPDLRGTQGSFTYFTSEPLTDQDTTGGLKIPLSVRDGKANAVINGPVNPMNPDGDPLSIPFILEKKNGGTVLRLAGQSPVRLKTGVYSDWLPLTFKAAPGLKVGGIARFLLTESDPHMKLYVTPVNIDPQKPALPVGNPSVFSVYLGKLLGRFATLGLAEDTWALNEKVISEQQFAEQVYQSHEEREAMLDLAMGRIRSGLVVCVFDTPDRIQHMFYKQHATGQGPMAETMHDMYKRMDALIGKIQKKIGKDDVLIVISDHGVRGFDRCLNINAWLKENGYLHLKPHADENANYYQAVEWSRTRAFGLGLTGIYVNIKGKGAKGIVEPGADVEQLKEEIREKLAQAVDPEKGKAAVKAVFDTQKIYNGPYVENAPDLVVCYDEGFRTSWDSVTGGCGGPVFHNNDKAWSGDHCAHPSLVPGVLFCNRPVTRERPHIGDIGPTTLHLFGITPPEYMQGGNLFGRGE
jgi:predicted AlkP superfamily phosphohydrolase/phosphomutase